MGLRFRKSVKICKGVRVNFSKSGASLSLGGRGHSVNFGSRGTRTTVGIPGTGLSYSKTVSNHKSRSSSHRNSSSRAVSRNTGVPLPSQVQLKMDPDGKIEIQDSRGIPITDQSVIRKIKSTDTYRTNLQNLEAQRRDMLESAFNEAKAENDKFIEIYKSSPQVDRREQYIQVLDSLRPPTYVRRQYDVPYPTEEMVRNQLKQEAKTSVQGGFLSVGRLRKEYVESNLQTRLDAAIYNWVQGKDDFEATESQNEISENERYNAEFNANKKYMVDLINGEDSVVSDALESWISSCELPVEINVSYEWNQSSHVMYLDVDLPEIEDLPENEVIRLASGNLREKKKTQATLKQEYVQLVFGLAIFISSNVFNASPAIQGIIISGYTQRRDKVGEVNDEYVYSIKFTRDIFERSVLKNVNPKDFCMRFMNRSNITNGMLMKKIEPYSIDETFDFEFTNQLLDVAQVREMSMPMAVTVPNHNDIQQESNYDDFNEANDYNEENIILETFRGTLEKNMLAITYKTKRNGDGSIDVIYKGKMVGSFNLDEGQSWLTYPMGNSGRFKRVEGSIEELAENTSNWVRFIMNYL